MGSGIRDVGPRIPMWSAKASDLTQWTFESALWETEISYTWGGDRRKTGNFGANFEVASLWNDVEKKENGGDGSTEHWIVCLGSEGYTDDNHPFDKWSLFVMGDMVQRANGSAELQIRASGVLDWGNSYALNTFYDSKNDRRVVWGWSQEDFQNRAGWAQGFVSTLTIPQELYVLKFKDVLAPDGGVVEGSGIWTKKEGSGSATYDVVTIGQHPLDDVIAGIQGEKQTFFSGGMKVTTFESLSDVNSSRFHLQTTITDLPSAESGNYAGIEIRASPDHEEYSTIKYFPFDNTVLFDRSASSLLPYTGKADFKGYFEPFNFANGTTEQLTFDIFVDGGLVEIFINNRFAMTNKIYPSRADALGAALVSSGGATFSSVNFWELETNVWPDRPLNASTTLLYDEYYQNHVTFDNPYVPTNYQIYDGN